MLSFRPTWLFTFLLLLLPSLAAQQQPQRDPQAVAVLQRAVTALGGASAYSSVIDAVATGTMHPASSVGPANFVWKDSGNEFRREMQTSSGIQVFVSGHGRPAVLLGGKTKSLFFHMALNPPFHLPGLVLFRMLGDARYSLTVIGPATVSGRAAVRVRTSLGTDAVLAMVTPQEWYFDISTGLPLKVEYRLPESLNAADFMVAAAEFSDFRQIAGVSIPFHILAFHEGKRVSEVTLTSVAFNSGVTSMDFELATGGGQ